MAATRSISGVSLEVEDKGDGRPLLFLHAGDPLTLGAPSIDMLAHDYRVIAPCLPGWGSSELPRWMTSVEDLAYLMLDLADTLGLENAVLAANSFGGWIAAEMLVRNQSRFGHAVLAAPFGCKFGERTEREITDIHALDQARLLQTTWADAERGRVDLTAKAEAELAQIAQAREAWALFGWKPYMHNPRLRYWLHRINVPTLILRGESDGVVGQDYVNNWAAGLANASSQTIADAGHYIPNEQPQAFIDAVRAFAAP